MSLDRYPQFISVTVINIPTKSNIGEEKVFSASSSKLPSIITEKSQGWDCGTEPVAEKNKCVHAVCLLTLLLGRLSSLLYGAGPSLGNGAAHSPLGN